MLSTFLMVAVLASGTIQSAHSAPSAKLLGENYQYTVSYRGILSSQDWKDIATATLATAEHVQIAAGEQAYLSTMSVTTAYSGKAESIYPFRFKFHSWYTPDIEHSLFVDKRMQSRKNKHELIWFDRERRVIKRYKRRTPKSGRVSSDAKVSAEQALPDFLRARTTAQGLDSREFQLRGHAARDLLLPVLDRLAMLQRLRLVGFQVGDVVDLPVSDGDDLIAYSVKVENKESLALNGRTWPAYKLRFEAVFSKDKRNDKTPSIYLWLGDTEQRTPLRLYTKRWFGEFDIRIDQASS